MTAPRLAILLMRSVPRHVVSVTLIFLGVVAPPTFAQPRSAPLEERLLREVPAALAKAARTQGDPVSAIDTTGKPVASMSDEVKHSDGLNLSAKVPLPAYVRLLRQGQEVAKSECKADFEFAVTEPGPTASKPGSNLTASGGRGYLRIRST